MRSFLTELQMLKVGAFRFCQGVVLFMLPCAFAGCSPESNVDTQTEEIEQKVEEESASTQLPVECLTIPAVAFYKDRNDAPPEMAEPQGSGFFVAKELDGAKRYFLVTAAHVTDLIMLDESCTGYQIGCVYATLKSVGRRKLPSKGTFDWKLDRKSDLAVCEITPFISLLENTGLKIMAVDLDAGATLSNTGSHILGLVGVATPDDYAKLDVRYGSFGVGIGFAPKENHLSNRIAAEWEMPFAIREGMITSMREYVELDYERSNLSNKRMYCVTKFLMRTHSKMSGGAVYIKDSSGRFYLYGVIIGYDAKTKHEMLATPIDKVIALIDKYYGGRPQAGETKLKHPVNEVFK